MSLDTYRAIGLLIPYAYDAVVYASYDTNGNPGTAKYYSGGTTGTLLCTITFSYDGSGNLLSMVRT